MRIITSLNAIAQDFSARMNKMAYVGFSVRVTEKPVLTTVQFDLGENKEEALQNAKTEFSARMKDVEDFIKSHYETNHPS